MWFLFFIENNITNKIFAWNYLKLIKKSILGNDIQIGTLSWHICTCEFTGFKIYVEYTVNDQHSE